MSDDDTKPVTEAEARKALNDLLALVQVDLDHGEFVDEPSDSVREQFEHCVALMRRAAAAQGSEAALRRLRARVHASMSRDADCQDEVHPCDVWSVVLPWIDQEIQAAMGYTITVSGADVVSPETAHALHDVAQAIAQGSEARVAVPADMIAKAERVVALHAASGELTNDSLSLARWVLSIAGGNDG